MAALIDLTNQRFGKLTALARSMRPGKRGTFWICLCDCGKQKTIYASNLRSGDSTSCGCNHNKKGEDTPRRAVTRALHGDDFVPFSDAWYRRAAGIMKRCRNDGIECDFPNICNFASYLIEIAPATCPVFGFPLVTAKGFRKPNSPSVDRIRPRDGYVRGNLQVISLKANVMKQNATAHELEQFAEWIMRGVYR